MAQWWVLVPPTNVVWVQIPASMPYTGWVCCWFSPLLWEVFLRVLWYSPVLENQLFQILIWPGIRQTKKHFVDVLPPSHYLILFYLFINIALHFVVKLFVLQMGDWPLEGWTWASCREGGNPEGSGLGVGEEGSEFMLGLDCDLGIWFTLTAMNVAAKQSLNTFWLVNIFLQAPSGTLLSQDEIDQILQIWTSMQRQIVSPTPKL